MSLLALVSLIVVLWVGLPPAISGYIRVCKRYLCGVTCRYRDVSLNLRVETEETRELGISGHVCEVWSPLSHIPVCVHNCMLARVQLHILLRCHSCIIF